VDGYGVEVVAAGSADGARVNWVWCRLMLLPVIYPAETKVTCSSFSIFLVNLETDRL
jgi:hypothetical protein